MPLIRIESRPRSEEREDESRRRRPSQAAARSGQRGGIARAMVVGVLLGILLIAGIVAVAIGMRTADAPGTDVPAMTAGGGQPPASPTQPGGPSSLMGGAAAGVSAVGSSLPSADPTLPFLNFDYPREAVVALVNGQPFTMGQLETAVRVGRALASLSGDPVPGYDTPEMRDFQIQMLRRQIDVVLMRQAFHSAGLEDPGLPIEGLTSGFLERVGATEERLQQAMAENGVRQEDLDAWFVDSQQVNLFVQQQLMLGRDQSERNQVTRDWLDQQWASADIFVNFYDPDMAAGDGGTAPEDASSADGAVGGDGPTSATSPP